MTIQPRAGRLGYPDAEDIARRVLDRQDSPVVRIDLSPATDATPAAFARLAALRNKLVAGGGDLRVLGLHGRVKDVYEICRLEKLLPQEPPG